MKVKFELRNLQSGEIGIQFEPSAQEQLIESEKLLTLIVQPDGAGGTIHLKLGKYSKMDYHQLFNNSFDVSIDAYYEGIHLNID